jgi:exopolyphosphatase/pppGpp-phosphohydrolase
VTVADRGLREGMLLRMMRAGLKRSEAAHRTGAVAALP